jgi:hypothetical protein
MATSGADWAGAHHSHTGRRHRTRACEVPGNLYLCSCLPARLRQKRQDFYAKRVRPCDPARARKMRPFRNDGMLPVECHIVPRKKAFSRYWAVLARNFRRSIEKTEETQRFCSTGIGWNWAARCFCRVLTPPRPMGSLTRLSLPAFTRFEDGHGNRLRKPDEARECCVRPPTNACPLSRKPWPKGNCSAAVLLRRRPAKPKAAHPRFA